MSIDEIELVTQWQVLKMGKREFTQFFARFENMTLEEAEKAATRVMTEARSFFVRVATMPTDIMIDEINQTVERMKRVSERGSVS